MGHAVAYFWLDVIEAVQAWAGSIVIKGDKFIYNTHLIVNNCMNTGSYFVFLFACSVWVMGSETSVCTRLGRPVRWLRLNID